MACRFVNFVVPMEIIFTAFLVVARKMEWDVRSVKFLSFYFPSFCQRGVTEQKEDGKWPARSRRHP